MCVLVRNFLELSLIEHLVIEGCYAVLRSYEEFLLLGT